MRCFHRCFEGVVYGAGSSEDDERWGSDTQGNTGFAGSYGSYAGSMAAMIFTVNLGVGRTATAIAGGYSST